MTGEYRREGHRNTSILHKQEILGIRQNTEITQMAPSAFLFYIVLPGKTVIQPLYTAWWLHSKPLTRPCSVSPNLNNPKISGLPNFPVSTNYQSKLPFYECSSSQIIFLKTKSDSQVLVSGAQIFKTINSPELLTKVSGIKSGEILSVTWFICNLKNTVKL